MSVKQWSENDKEALAKLLEEGLSGSQIGGLLGYSRNAVIGKAHRMRLQMNSRNKGGWDEQRLQKHRMKPKLLDPETVPVDVSEPMKSIAQLASLIKPAIPAPATERPQPMACTIYELTSATCCWPLWDNWAVPVDRFYCGAPSEGVYCQYHHNVAYRPNEPRLRRQA